MASMAEHEASMTIYYYMSNGEIYSSCSGINDLSTFGVHQVDYELILDFIVVPKDELVMQTMHHFYVDTETKQLKLRPEYNELAKYL